MQKTKLSLTIVSLFIIIGNVFAQCGLYELSLTDKVNKSTDIFEGKVISQTCFWNAQQTLIFTSNIVEVYKVFKGSVTKQEVEIITEGGIVGNNMHKVEPSLELEVGDIGIFTAGLSDVLNSQSTFNSNSVFKCYGSLQGFFRYDLLDKSAVVPFQKYNDITNDLYTAIQNITNATFNTIISYDVNKRPSTLKAGVTITGFSPTTITAGTNSVLTIDGGGFGSTRGTFTVQFKNADDGGASYVTIPSTSQYISWSDTQIKVKVPEKAGTGTIRVVASATATSTATLTVNYAEMNVISSNVDYQSDHVNKNSAGGMTWQMYTTFDNNAAAKASIIRAINSWRCATHINWVVGSTTTVNTIARDGTCVIRYDNGSELSSGVLGQCSTYWSGCSKNGTSVWYVDELDMSIDDGANWEYGPAAPAGAKYDFESVMLHELGHGHQLGHVIKGSDVMNYAIANASNRRTLNINNKDAGNDVMSRSIVANTCGPGAMTKLADPCAIGAPVASFSVTPVSGCTPLSVTFSDLSSNTPTTWAWDVDNNGTFDYTTKNPTHVYNAAGTYSVKLKVTNGNGVDSIIKTNYITVTASPTAGFSSTVNSGTVSFTNTSTNANSYSWNFGDSSPLTTITNASHTYSVAATYTVTLTATNSCTSSSISHTVTIGANGAINKPVPNFSANTSSGCTPLTVTFSDLSTNTPTSWAWDVDNNGTVDYTTQNPTHVYNSTGNYSVKLKVINGAGADSITKTAYITIPPAPVASFSNIINGGTVNFTNTTINANTYSWNFGDSNSSTSTSVTVPHTYANAGTYSVTLTATGACGSNTFSTNITVGSGGQLNKPSPDFSSNKTSGCNPLTVIFSDLSTNNPTSWLWDINNDGVFDYTSQNPTHTYATAGTYAVKLKVSNGIGTDSITKTNYITVTANPTVTVPTSLTICSGFMVMTNPFSSNPAGATYTWTNTNTSIGLSANGNGNLSMFIAANSTGSPISSSITVTPTLNGCLGSSSSFSITVKPVSTATVPSNINVCSESSVAATSFTSNPAGSTYTWTNSNTSIGLATNGSGDVPAFTASNNTSAPIEGIINVTPILNGCPSSASTYTITVNPLDNATFSYSKNIFCQGDVDQTPSITLAGGTFSSTSGLSINSLSGIINISSSSLNSYSITYLTNGQCPTSSSANVLITGSPDATFSYNSPFCKNETSNPLPIFASGASAGTFSSTSGMSFISANTGEIDLSTSNPGTYEITNSIASSGACIGANATYTVIINPLPVAGFSSTINSGTVTFVNSSTNADTYNWDFGDSQSSTVTDETHKYTKAKTYTVTLTATNSCGSDTINQIVLIKGSGVGINELANNEDFMIYPNPTDGQLTIEFPTDIKGSNISVLNYLGEIMMDVKQTKSLKKLTIDLSNLTNGVYCIIVNTKDGVVSKNVILMK